MKGKINLKTIIIFAILVLAIVLSVLGVRVAKTFMSGASADYQPQNLTAVSAADGSTATISWTTDKSATASVFYGTVASNLLLMAEDAQATTDHNISLTNLKAGKTYYYKIVVGDSEFNDTGDVPYSFKTSGSAEATKVVTPTIIPTVAPVVTLPPTSSISGTPVASSSACDKTTDYVKDGVINSLDYISCLRGKITPTKAATK